VNGDQVSTSPQNGAPDTVQSPARRITAAATLSLVLAATGCMVGPKYVKPTTPTPPAFRESPPVDGDWKAAQPSDAYNRGEWWTIFNDPDLNTLEPQVAINNQDLKAAAARLVEARSQIQFNRSNLAPTIGVAPFAGGSRISANRPYFNSTLANNGEGDLQLPVELNYEVDLWGRVRRSVTAAKEQTQASAADLQTALLSLQSELAMDYFELRSADAQAKLLTDTVVQYRDALRVTTDRFNGGISAESDLDQAKTQLQAALVQASDILLLRAQYEHAIAVLIGKPPAEFILPVRPLAARPPAIPVGLPSELLERRPDIAAAERRVAAANEQIGIARAAYFPSLSISALAGIESNAFNNLFSASSLVYALGPTLSQTFFDYGRRRSISEDALAGFDETTANYRQTTLTAYQQVEDNLVALRILSQEADQQRSATDAAKAAQVIFNNRYVGGIDTYLQVITAQTTALVNERNDIDIMRRQMDASVLLVKALGGGWNVTKLPKY
jgi:NodT family efflux transporter outer membrane factor (OMF) lipoprotein